MHDPMLAKKFERLGARLRMAPGDAPFRIDLARDEFGEYFDLRFKVGAVAGLQALDVQPSVRHLLLLARVRDDAGAIQKQKFLCGHNERAWFVAAVPGEHASTVRTAMHALKPRIVQLQELGAGVRFQHRNRRRNGAFVRQGEWFFIPRRG